MSGGRRESLPPVDAEALTVAMTVAPGAYARNRTFSLFTHPEVRGARVRAAVLRGIVRQLKSTEPTELSLSREQREWVLCYRISEMSFARRVGLSEVEAACLRYLGGRAEIPGLSPSAEDRAMLEAVLRRLASGLRLE